jgi:zinc/manganese transport system substrate-binding protein
MSHAALVVANGLDLEEGMAPSLEQVEADGVPVFRATDHITVRRLGPGEPSDEHDHGGEDPHFWTDPLTVRQLAPALGDALQQVLGTDLSERVRALEQSLDDLDAQVRQIMSVLPTDGCVLVTGHDSLGYFAARYGCTIVGAIVPSLSSTAEASAKDLADLHDAVERAHVRAIFTEVGTPKQVAEQVARDAGVPLVELPSHALPDAGGYRAFIVDLATKIAQGLTAS